MSWEKTEEEGTTIYLNQDVGNIIETDNGEYICVLPKVFKLGPFKKLDHAKSAAEDAQGLGNVIDNYNTYLLNLMKQVAGKE